MLHRLRAGMVITAGLCALLFVPLAQGQGRHGKAPAVKGPWSDKSSVAGPARGLVDTGMTLDEKIQLLHGSEGPGAIEHPVKTRSNGGAGWVPGIERLGIPDINMADSAVGITLGGDEEPLFHGAAIRSSARRPAGTRIWRCCMAR